MSAFLAAECFYLNKTSFFVQCEEIDALMAEEFKWENV
jgi:hypothetical protein